jgi:Zn ribbon nucleic-acid-binding protein
VEALKLVTGDAAAAIQERTGGERGSDAMVALCSTCLSIAPRSISGIVKIDVTARLLLLIIVAVAGCGGSHKTCVQTKQVFINQHYCMQVSEMNTCNVWGERVVEGTECLASVCDDNYVRDENTGECINKKDYERRQKMKH